MVLYISFDMIFLAVEPRDLSQADKSVFFFNLTKLQFLNDKIYSYPKKTIWHLEIWFYHSKIGKIEK